MSKLKSLGSLRSARTNMPSVCYVCAMICTDTYSVIARASGRSVLVETFKTDVTNSILEIRLAAYCPIFGMQLLYLKPDRGTQLVNPSYDSCFAYRKYPSSGCDSCFAYRKYPSSGCDSCFTYRKYRPSGCDSCFAYRKYLSSGCDSCFAYRRYRSSVCDSFFAYWKYRSIGCLLFRVPEVSIQ
jgi:hypothetical protein